MEDFNPIVDQDKIKANFPSGVPVCRVFVYRNNKPEYNSNPHVLPVHMREAPEGRMNPPWYCVLGFSHDLKASISDEALERGAVSGLVDVDEFKKAKGTEKYKVKPAWQVVSARVNLTRAWNCSMATVQIARPYDVEDNAYSPPIRPEDVIVIEMGYTDSLISVKARMDTVFYGIVDNVKERGGSGEDGIVVTVVARDSMRYLQDNRIRGTVLIPDVKGGRNRAEIVKDVLYRGAAVDYVKWTNETIPITETTDDGTKVTHAYLKKPKKNTKAGKDPDLIEAADFGPDNSFIRVGKVEKSRRKELSATDERGLNQSIVIIDKSPLDLVKHMSLVETAPRELYADHRTGEINWTFRRTDARRLYGGGKTTKNGAYKDPKVQEEAIKSRQFFYRKPGNRANVISYTNEWTTVGSISHFALTTPQALSDSSKRTNDIYAESPLALFDDPHGPRDSAGRPTEKLRKFTRNRYVYDESLTGNENAEMVVLALFTTWGRDIQGGMVHIPGDPTLEIGEAVQLFNMGLFGKRYNPNANNKSQPGTWGPEGFNRVEAVSHQFAVGGAQRGFTTIFWFGPCDPATGEKETKRLIEDDTDWEHIKTI